MPPLCQHLLIDYHDCDAETLKHSDQVKAAVVEAVRLAHGTFVADVFHNFSPYGVSGVVVIAESHVTVHTWPEHGYAAVDVFSCSKSLQRNVIRALLKKAFGARRVSSTNLKRGLIAARRRPK